MALSLSSPAFENGEQIPERFVREGRNISPPLTWTDVPEGTRSFLIIMEDPDAPRGTFRHWGLYDISGKCAGLPEGADGAEVPRFGHGVNDFGNARYDGPQPPPGHGRHHYHFRLAALDLPRLSSGESASISALLEHAHDHVIATAELVGTYEKS